MTKWGFCFISLSTFGAALQAETFFESRNSDISLKPFFPWADSDA